MVPWSSLSVPLILALFAELATGSPSQFQFSHPPYGDADKSTKFKHPIHRVAVIGGGPNGLQSVRWLPGDVSFFVCR